MQAEGRVGSGFSGNISFGTAAMVGSLAVGAEMILAGPLQGSPIATAVTVTGTVALAIFWSYNEVSDNFHHKATTRESQPAQCDFTNLPVEALGEIFSRVDLRTFTALPLVCKDWNDCRLQNPGIPRALVYHQVAFKVADFKKHWPEHSFENEDVEKEIESLPLNIFEDLMSDCPANRGKKKIQTHMLVRRIKTCDDQDLVLSGIGKLGNEILPCNANTVPGFEFIHPGKLQELDIPVPNSYWMLKLIELDIETLGENWTNQQARVARLGNGLKTYEAPKVDEEALCDIAYRARFGEWPRKDYLYTRCLEKGAIGQMAEACAPSGLTVSNYSALDDDIDAIGVAALRKF